MKIRGFVFCTTEDRHLGEYVLTLVKEQCEAELLYDSEMHGIIPMQNAAIKKTRPGTLAWFVHADVIVKQDTLYHLENFMDNTGCKAVEAELIHDDGVILHGTTERGFVEKNLDVCDGFPNSIHTACTLIEAGLPIEYFPPDAWQFGFDDVWLSQSMLRGGYRIGHCPEARCLHLGSYFTKKTNILNKIAIQLLYRNNKKALIKKFGEPLMSPKIDITGTELDNYRMSKYRKINRRQIINK